MGLSILVDMLRIKSIQEDIEECIRITDLYANMVPQVFVDALIVSEDHRNNLHSGVDVIAMLRALYVLFRFGRVQGASTIEQQYVRVVSKRFERTARRKFREQMLALKLVRRRSKKEIATAYLAIAYYGTDNVGLKGILAEFEGDLSNVTLGQAIRFMAQLKYPRPRTPSNDWCRKIEMRVAQLLKNTEAGKLASLREFRSDGIRELI
jgi:penicillin-binding protein 1A